MSTPMSIPPKMLAQFAQRAKNKDYDYRIGTVSSAYVFLLAGNIRVCLVSLDPPIGHQMKITAKEMENEKMRAAEWRTNNPQEVQ